MAYYYNRNDHRLHWYQLPDTYILNKISWNPGAHTWDRDSVCMWAFQKAPSNKKYATDSHPHLNSPLVGWQKLRTHTEWCEKQKQSCKWRHYWIKHIIDQRDQRTRLFWADRVSMVCTVLYITLYITVVSRKAECTICHTLSCMSYNSKRPRQVSLLSAKNKNCRLFRRIISGAGSPKLDISMIFALCCSHDLTNTV